MLQRTRIVIAIAVIILLIGIVLGVEWIQRRAIAEKLAPGSIPIYVRGKLSGRFLPTDLERIDQVNFVDDEQGKTQQGWLLRDVLLLYVPPDTLQTLDITVSSSSRDKSITLTWREVENAENMVMFDLSGRGTLKLVSKLERFATRDVWVQDVDRIDVKE